MARNVLVLKHFESPKEAGTYYRLVCLTGANKGEAYVLLGSRIVLGRSEKADIKLGDIKASREHAEITKVGDNWVVTDLGSQNGMMVNENKITQTQLAEGDKIIIGQTVLKFAKVEVSSKDKVIKEVEKTKSVGKKSLVPVLLAAIFVFMVLLDDEDAQNNKKAPPPAAVVDVTADYELQLKKRQASESKQVKEKLTTIFHKGLREYREGNYLRAVEQFQYALSVDPNNSQAEYYLRKSKEELDRAIDGFNVKGQRDEGALKYQSAIVSYCAIIRLLYFAPEDQRYKDAVSQIEKLETKLGMEPGETECLKKPRIDN